MGSSSLTTFKQSTADLFQRLRTAHTFPYLALGSGLLFLTMSGFFIRWAQAPGVVTAFYRMAFAAAFLIPFYARLPVDNRRLRGNPAWLIPLGGLCISLDQALWSTAATQTTLATATLLGNVSPLWVGLFAMLVWREQLSIRFWFGLVLALAGMAIIFGSNLVANPGFRAGDLLGLASSFFYAGYMLVTQRARARLGTLAYICPTLIVAAFFLLLINIITSQQLTGYPPLSYLVFLGAALVSQVAGYFSIIYALGHLPAAIVAPTMVLQPVLIAMLAIPILGEMLQPTQWLGGLVVLVGIYLVNQR